MDFAANRLYLEKEEHAHWCPISEPVTGGDKLKAMLAQGWMIHGECVHYIRQMRGCSVHLYSICLQREFHMVRMTVIRNPYVERVLRDVVSVAVH